MGAHGSTREIDLDAPNGMALADVLPSDKLWVAHFQPAHHDPDQPLDNHKMPYYQFDPSNGTLTAKIEIHGDSPEQAPALIACEEEGTFLSFTETRTAKPASSARDKPAHCGQTAPRSPTNPVILSEAKDLLSPWPHLTSRL